MSQSHDYPIVTSQFNDREIKDIRTLREESRQLVLTCKDVYLQNNRDFEKSLEILLKLDKPVRL